MGGFSASVICEGLSRARMKPYLSQVDGDEENALALYGWSTQMASAAFEIVAHLEVLLRNAIDQALSEHFRDAERGIPWFFCAPPMNDETGTAIDSVRARLRPQGRDTRAQIIAGLSFGFWTGMLGRKYEELWRTALRHAFPGSSGARKQVAAEIEAVRKFRNRLAHHDSMLKVDVPFEIRRVRRIIGFVSADAEAWLNTVDRTEEVYSRRPHPKVDTVIVAARDAWAFYEKQHAYVCQPGRVFRPVERMAFYAGQEVKTSVPRILHRRDEVPWTEHEAERLDGSGDRNDRKIAAVIRAHRAEGSRGGVHQVFLLSSPGNPDHRELETTLPHVAAGPGSAFVQRQRYVSLHSLETSTTTQDLSVGV